MSVGIYLLPALILSALAAVFFLAAFFGDGDEDASMWCALAFVGAWLWPLIIPLAVISLIVFMFMHIFIMFEWMRAPEWWPDLY